jgi:hypothetical protein
VTDALNRVETEIRSLTNAVAAGGELSALVKALKDREVEAERLRRQLVNAERAEKRTEGTPTRMRAQLEQKLAESRDVLRRQPVIARQIVKKMLVGPLRLTPKQDSDGTRYYE